MRWRLALPLFAALVAAAGCRSDCRRVESELRAREDDVRTLKEDVGRLGCLNDALTRELTSIRGEPGPDGLIHKPSEPYPVRSLVLGRQTGGRNDSTSGDDGLIVILEPRDCDDQAIKAPGAVVIDVIETPREGVSRPLSRYEISPDELRPTWQSGLFSNGYRLPLTFKRYPTTDRLRVVAYFRMMNGRVFQAGKDVTIRLAPGRAERPEPPPPTPPPGYPPPPVPPGAPETKSDSVLPPPLPESEKKPDSEKPAPESVLPPPMEEKVKEKKPPPPPDPPSGPILTRVKGQTATGAVEMYRPVPLREE